MALVLARGAGPNPSASHPNRSEDVAKASKPSLSALRLEKLLLPNRNAIDAKPGSVPWIPFLLPGFYTSLHWPAEAKSASRMLTSTKHRLKRQEKGSAHHSRLSGRLCKAKISSRPMEEAKNVKTHVNHV